MSLRGRSVENFAVFHDVHFLVFVSLQRLSRQGSRGHELAGRSQRQFESCQVDRAVGGGIFPFRPSTGALPE
jgi:hypothetical protein